MKIAYLRVSSRQQSTSRQRELIINEHPDVEKFFEEKASGFKERPILDELLPKLRFGDTLIVESFSRLSRSTSELLQLLEFFEKKEINFISIKESHLTGHNGKSATIKLMITMMAALSTFEAELTKERTSMGIELLKKRGPVTRKKKYTKGHEKLELALELYEEGNKTVTEICKGTGVSRPTLYMHLKKRGIALKTK